MADESINPNVVLTADNSQYDQAMMSSAGTTDQMVKAVDTLTAKISKTSKIAGGSLIGIAAADVAIIGKATSAWAQYEKEVSRLNAQAAILTRTQTQQTRVMGDYEKAIKGLRTEYGTTTTEAAKLVTTLSKMTNVRQTRELTSLSKVFVDMSKATGESSEGLATSLTSLQKLMGNDINARSTRKYADQFTYLSAQTNTSAQGLIEFSKQLAPVGRQIGLNTDQIAGFATAFARAGEDGFAAANVFNKIANDISYSMQTGSPEIAKFANLIGVTQKQFKALGGEEQIVRILESLQTMGPRAAQELNRLGLDGTRSMKSITAVINEAGGIREALNLSEDSRGAAKEGAKAARKGLSDEVEELQQELQQMSEHMGSFFGPMTTEFVGGMDKMANTMRKVMEGPFGDFAAMLAAILAPLAGGTGALLLFGGALLKVAGAFTLFRNSGALGVREGFRGSGTITRNADGTYSGGGVRGQQIASGGSWFQRGMYNTGAMTGSVFSGMRDRYTQARLRMDPTYTPRGALAPLSLAAGGMGRAIQNFLVPQYDQMRYADPSQRMQWLNMTTPWARAADRTALSRSMGAVGTAQDQLREVRREQLRVMKDPMLTEEERKARMANLNQIKEETKQRLSQSQYAQRDAQERIANSHKVNAAADSGAKGMARFGEAARAAGGAMVGSLWGGTKTAVPAIAKSPMAAPIGSMMAMGGLAAAGVESNMANFAAMGLMMGPTGAAVGAGVGGVLDMVQANNKVGESIKFLDEQATQASKTGSGLVQLDEQYEKTKKDLDEFQGSMKDAQEHRNSMNPFDFSIQSPKQTLAGLKNDIEGIFGKSDEEELQEKFDAAKAKRDRTMEAARDLAAASGQTIQGTSSAQTAQLETFMSEKGTARLAAQGLTLEDLTKAKEEGRDQDYAAMLAKIGAGITTATDQLRRTAAGQVMMGSQAATKSLRYQESVPDFFAATNEMYSMSRARGLSPLQILASAERTQNIIGNENDRGYELQAALAGRARQVIQMQQPFMGRTGQFRSTLGMNEVLATQTPRTGENAQQVDEARSAIIGTFTEQYQHFQQLLYQQREFEVSQSRALEDFGVQRERMDEQYHLGRQRQQEDYHQSRQRQEADYQRGRRRAEFDYNLQRERGQDDYDRSVRRARQDFNRQRLRQERDYNHQVVLMAESAAKQMYNVYDRVRVEATNSSSYLLVNAQDQLQRMQNQGRNLDKVRGLGLSDDAIQQLGLTDASNSQQLERLTAELSDNPEMVKQFNKAIRQRLRAAQRLVTDESSTEWQEFQRQHRLARRRAANDFERSVERGHKDFRRQMSRMEEDFRRQMNRGAEDYEIAQTRQQEDFSKSMKRGAHDYGVAVDQMTTDFHKSMNRAQADLERSAEEITGSLTKMLTKATNKLSGNAAKQAGEVLEALRDLRQNAGAEGNELMELMAEIFGFDFTPVKPKHHKAGGRNRNKEQNATGMNVQPATGTASGGVLPGYSPNKDIHQFHSATGGELHLSGGEAIMVPEWVQLVGGPAAVARMNAKARSGTAGPNSFASGGVNPDRRVYVDGEPLSAISAAQLLLAERLGGRDMHVMQGSWQPYTSYSGSSHMGPGVIDTGPGDFKAQYDLRRVGFAAWGRNFPGAATAGSGAHVHSVSRVDPGARNHAQLSSFARSEDGLGGRDYGPNPPMLPDLLDRLDRFMGVAVFGGDSKGLGRAKLNSILKDRYPRLERAAARMHLLGGFPDGHWSDQLNKWARQAYNRLAPNTPGWGGKGGSYSGMPQGPDHGSNQDLVRRAMLDQGWHQWPALYQLVMHESSFNNRAQNPSSSAYGMFQFLDPTWANYGGHKTSDPWQQAVLGMRYIKGRYGDPNGAWDFWQRNHWYAEGGLFDGPQTIGVGEKGPEAVIPLNDQGADFLRKTMSGLGGRGVGLTGSTPLLANTIHNYQIDRSTTFTGAITVQANNPNELINQLRARQRTAALSQAALGGARV